MIKKLLPLLTALLLCLALCGCSIEAVEKYPDATDKFFVNDFAEVIDSADEDEIYNRCVALYEKTTAQVVVVTVDSLQGEEPADYATELGRRWGIGTKDKDNGVLLLLATEERQVYIAVGYGLEGALPDSKTGRILDVYGVDKFSNDEFSAGLLDVSKALVNEVYIENGVEPETGYTAIDKVEDDAEEDDAYYEKIGISWLVLILIVIILSIIFRKKLRIFFGPGGGFYNTHGGGSFGGNDSGFGGFSGGGGSFGGGGAGRGF